MWLKTVLYTYPDTLKKFGNFCKQSAPIYISSEINLGDAIRWGVLWRSLPWTWQSVTLGRDWCFLSTPV